MGNKVILTVIGILTLVFRASAQHADINAVTDSITNEGKMLYRSEWASWYGTDIFLEKCKDKRSQIGGYISYETKDGINNIFVSKGDEPIVLATTSFGNNFDANNYSLDTIQRKLTIQESELLAVRLAGVKLISTDTTFKFFKNTELNPVPIIKNGVKKIYVLTGPKVNGVIVFGNDYLISLDKSNKVESIKRLHKNIIPVNYATNTLDSNKIEISGMHSHLAETGDFITATDICTLMLYENFTTWKQYYVISKNYVSIWDCKKNQLFVMTTEAWKRIAQDQSANHPPK